MTNISVVVSAYNEEENLKECLESAKLIADEIIVVDNSSQDNTAKIAKTFTKKVYTQPNNPKNIDIQKNFGFDKASGDWIFCLDADERVTSELAEEIKTFVGGQLSIVGYWIPRKNIIFNKWIKSDMWWPDYQLRIFMRGKGKYEKQKVHNSLVVEGETAKLENPLIHHNYKSIHQYLQKLNNYTDNEADALSESGYKFNWLDSIRFPVNDFVKTFFLQKGYKDGIHGLVLSMFQAFYMGIVFAKLWEKAGYTEIEDENFVHSVKKEFISSAAKIKYWIASTIIGETKNPLKKIILRTSRKVLSTKIKS